MQRRQVEPLEFIRGIQGATVVAGETFPADTTDTTFITFSTGYSILLIAGRNAGVKVMQMFAPISSTMPRPATIVQTVDEPKPSFASWDAPVEPPIVKAEGSVQQEAAVHAPPAQKHTITPEQYQSILREIAQRKGNV